MSKEYFILSPEVAGEIGSQTTTGNQPKPGDAIEYLVDHWPCDEIITSTPHFVISAKLRGLLEYHGMTGGAFYNCKLGISYLLEQFRPDIRPNELYWGLLPKGKPGTDDIFFSENQDLVVSEPIVDLLSQVRANHCEIEPFYG